MSSCSSACAYGCNLAFEKAVDAGEDDVFRFVILRRSPRVSRCSMPLLMRRQGGRRGRRRRLLDRAKAAASRRRRPLSRATARAAFEWNFSMMSASLKRTLAVAAVDRFAMPQRAAAARCDDHFARIVTRESRRRIDLVLHAVGEREQCPGSPSASSSSSIERELPAPQARLRPYRESKTARRSCWRGGACLPPARTLSSPLRPGPARAPARSRCDRALCSRVKATAASTQAWTKWQAGKGFTATCMQFPEFAETGGRQRQIGRIEMVLQMACI